MGISKLNRKKWRCRLLIYSGRPNPQWPVNDPVADGWLKLCHEAPMAYDTVPDAAALGYRGVIFYRGNDFYYIFNNHIRYMENEQSILKQDDDRKLEKEILSTAPKEIRQLATESFNED